MTTPEPADLEFFVLTDTIGDYAVGKTPDDARENYENEIQALAACDGFRIDKVTLSMPLPAGLALAGKIDRQPDGRVTLTLEPVARESDDDAGEDAA